jgi:hypothetical protein
MTMRRIILLLVGGVLTGVATEVGKQVVISEQFHQTVRSMLAPSQSRPGDHPPARRRIETTASAPNRPMSTPRGLPPAPPPSHTARDDRARPLSPGVKCPSPEETPWQRDEKGDSIIWKCINHRYFSFQCANELALVTSGVNKFTTARFPQSAHAGSEDMVLAAERATPYYYYSLNRRLFSRFTDSPSVALVQDNADVLYLDLTNVKRLSKLAFPGCIEA